jgi:hypothetical protein
MELQHTPIQVLFGEAGMDIEAYKVILGAEVKETLQSFNMDEATLKFYGDFVFLLFYWAATHRELHRFAGLVHKKIPDEFPLKENLMNMVFLQDMTEQNEDLVDMLRAILAGMSLALMDGGKPPEDVSVAVQNAAGVYAILRHNISG